MPLLPAEGSEARRYYFIELQGTLDSEKGYSDEVVGELYESEVSVCNKIELLIL